MKMHCGCLVLATALLAMGCAPQEHAIVGEGTGTSNIQMVGFAHDSSIGPDSTKKSVGLSKLVETDGVMAFDVVKIDTDPIQNYRVIFGISEGENTSAKGFVLENPHPSDILRSVARFKLIGNCWVYVYGQSPLLETGRVSAGSDGSALLIQIDMVDDVHRVYYLAGTENATVWHKSLAQPLSLPPGKFVEAKNNGTLTAAANIPAADPNGSSIQKFLAYVDCQIQPFKK